MYSVVMPTMDASIMNVYKIFFSSLLPRQEYNYIAFTLYSHVLLNRNMF